MSSNHPFPSIYVLDQLEAIVGVNHALRVDRDDLTQFTDENRDLIKGKTPIVLKPGSVDEVQAIVRLAAKEGLALVPQGGHTGHAGGGVPTPNGNEIVVALSRLNKIREIDLFSNTITVEAGSILQSIQTLADENDRFFPLALGSQGSCMIGGNISTNAGGTGVLAYGNMRELVLGLEVVLPNGDLWNGLSKLKKNNTGYHLKHLFIGGEGTLGIVTAATLKLFAKPVGREVAMLAVQTPDDALSIFSMASEMAGTSLTAFEIMPKLGFDFVFRHNETVSDPFPTRHPWNILVEISSTRSKEDARSLIEALYLKAEESGLVSDAVIGESESQCDQLWKIRETLPPSQKPEGRSIKHDVSVPVRAIPSLIERGIVAIEKACPGARPLPFGHMGDGNIHFNVSIPSEMADEEFIAHTPAIQDAVHSLVIELEGSISAEHGIGLLKRDLLQATKSEIELNMMKSVKQALDPKNIMNPGRIFEL